MSKRPKTPKKHRGQSSSTGKRQAAAAGSSRSTTAARRGNRVSAKRPTAIRGRESLTERRARALQVLTLLREEYPDADCALQHGSAYELLVATILSAQCTDERVNQVTPDLFRKYPDVESLAVADPDDVEALIRSTGFFRNKTKSLLGMSRCIVEEYGGEIPAEMEKLVGLPGVARKTANCVLGTWFGENVGVVVDTHVGRLAQRLRFLLTARDDKDAVKIEQDLMRLFPREHWTFLSHALILHGRAVCTARKPRCTACRLRDHCPSADSFE